MATKTGTEPAALNQTPCPDWCTADHEVFRLHRALVAEKPTRKPLDSGSVSVVDLSGDGQYIEIALNVFGHDTAWIQPEEAARLAAVLESLKTPAWVVRGLREASVVAHRIKTGNPLEEVADHG